MSDYTAELGDVVSVHRVDNKRRRRIIRTTLAAGLATGVIGLALLAQSLEAGDANGTGVGANGMISDGWGGFIGITGVLLYIGLSHLRRERRAGSDEAFKIHKSGLAYHSTSFSCSYTCDQVATVRVQRFPGPKAAGYDVLGEITFRDGVRLTFNGLTDDAEKFAQTLESTYRMKTVPIWQYPVR